MLRKIFKSLINAFDFGDQQLHAVIMLTLPHILLIILERIDDLLFILFLVLFYPVFAYIVNFFDSYKELSKNKINLNKD